MNREVLFRAFDKKLGRLLEVISIDFENDFIMLTDGEMRTSSSFNNCILEQYTGLKDKNGKEIFEGDRVIYLLYSDIFKVYWSNETFGWQLECIDSSEGDDGWVEYLSEFGSKDLEVIGNIHEEV